MPPRWIVGRPWWISGALKRGSVGERRMGNKNFPTRTKTYHGDVHIREGISDLRTLVDRTAEAIRDRG